MKTLKHIMIGNILLALIVAVLFTVYLLSTGDTAVLLDRILDWAITIFIATYGISVAIVMTGLKRLAGK